MKLELAKEWVDKNICYSGLEYPIDGTTFRECTASWCAGFDAAKEMAVKLCEEDFKVACEIMRNHGYEPPTVNHGLEKLKALGERKRCGLCLPGKPCNTEFCVDDKVTEGASASG